MRGVGGGGWVSAGGRRRRWCGTLNTPPPLTPTLPASPPPPGPTLDDVTMRAVADAFGARLVRHPSLEARVRGHFGEHTTEAHLKMAEAPDSEWGVSVGGSSITLTHTQPPRRAQRRLGVGVGWPHTTHPTHTHNYARQALRWRCLSIAWREARCRPSRSSAAATSTSCRVGGCRVLCVWGGVVAQRQGSQGGELAAEHVGRHTRTPTSPPPPPHTHTPTQPLHTPHHPTPPRPAGIPTLLQSKWASVEEAVVGDTPPPPPFRTRLLRLALDDETQARAVPPPSLSFFLSFFLSCSRPPSLALLCRVPALDVSALPHAPSSAPPHNQAHMRTCTRALTHKRPPPSPPPPLPPFNPRWRARWRLWPPSRGPRCSWGLIRCRIRWMALGLC